ncbi:uncharacterized protein LOC113869997 [Abrus precatorius]|uniref:Uncharacterized protein LOC113869997 n=1 Tax=Abrus precatorius TaxID=3816 RepID=A0A8B8M360_ABRPR|nr:uncharacterized protein LOC113869997 [Abrus precatorius]XP_027362383.1 uncharacterized protein LOC113869997 [Abrus precatorius]
MFGPSQPAPKSTVKFLCSYGGKILPRYPDGKLRYLGGHTRVLAVERSIPFTELLLKLEELCGSSVRHLRCQLPDEDLDALVSITSDEDLANLIEEYERVVSPLKIRAFLSPPRSSTKVFTPPSSSLSKSASSSSSSSASSTSSSSSYCSPTAGGSGSGSGRRYRALAPVVERCVHHMSPPTAFPVGAEKSSGRNIRVPRYGYHHAHGSVYMIHHGLTQD